MLLHPNSRPILLLLAGRCSQMHRLPLSNLPNIIFLCIALRSTLKRHSHLEAQIPLTVRAQRHNSSSGEQLSSRHLLATHCTRHPGKKKNRDRFAQQEIERACSEKRPMSITELLRVPMHITEILRVQNKIALPYGLLRNAHAQRTITRKV